MTCRATTKAMTPPVSFPDQEPREAHCQEHGPYLARKLPSGNVWSSCPECMDREQGECRRRENEALAKVRFEQRKREAGIPQRFLTASLETFLAQGEDSGNVLEGVRRYAKNFTEHRAAGRCLTFIGPPGTGKTHMGCSVLAHVLQAGGTGRYARAFGLVQAIKESWGGQESGVSEAQAMKVFTKPDLLVLDEVGIQYGSDVEKIILFQILDERYAEMRPTIVISNFNRDRLEAVLGPRIMDRLAENGGKVLPFNWPSYRRGDK